MGIKLVMLPESYNRLRQVLTTEHEDLWAKVGYFMAYDHASFIEVMNDELLCDVLPTTPIATACNAYLTALRLRKGHPARKSLELIQRERTGMNSLEHIFGTAEDDAEREDVQNWMAKNPNKPAPNVLMPSKDRKKVH